jgi:hypothetical protein
MSVLRDMTKNPLKTFCAIISFKLLQAENKSIKKRHPIILQCVITFEFDRFSISYTTHTNTTP